MSIVQNDYVPAFKLYYDSSKCIDLMQQDRWLTKTNEIEPFP